MISDDQRAMYAQQQGAHDRRAFGPKAVRWLRNMSRQYIYGYLVGWLWGCP